ncbi:MAG: hypothetical protein JRG67_14600 [Deltaproteobacteria bacterium]|nr:hypothetical protein [Deltaproteobacteria bacterium]MBW2686606.1 hypothetical protein [Deltaproteobacteria bacterium]
MLPTLKAAEEASEVMMRFAERTGLTSDRPKQRYLWTDAFAVCNFLGLAQVTGEERYMDLALRLVDQVHHVLGSYRADDSRSGWISGLSEQEGEAHPTRGGLRIGKALPERGVSEPFDEQLEWQQDGQYFHYLTKWMHALDQVSRWTRQPHFNGWARELAEVSHDAFTYTDQSGRRMFWKMSTDLSRPLVPSMGHHDPLDGFITCIQLQATQSTLSSTATGPSLNEAVADFATIIEGQDWTTADPLGLGGLLMDAARVAQLMHLGAIAGAELLESLLVAALQGLSHYARQDELRRPASQRLAFREIGLAIGLSAIELIEKETETEHRHLSRGAEVLERIEALTPYVALGSAIKSFWLEPEHREARTWSEHRDINEVMLATSLLPTGFLDMSLARIR